MSTLLILAHALQQQPGLQRSQRVILIVQRMKTHGVILRKRARSKDGMSKSRRSKRG
jgi:hypothetical protein